MKVDASVANVVAAVAVVGNGQKMAFAGGGDCGNAVGNCLRRKGGEELYAGFGLFKGALEGRAHPFYCHSAVCCAAQRDADALLLLFVVAVNYILVKGNLVAVVCELNFVGNVLFYYFLNFNCANIIAFGCGESVGCTLGSTCVAGNVVACELHVIGVAGECHRLLAFACPLREPCSRSVSGCECAAEGVDVCALFGDCDCYRRARVGTACPKGELAAAVVDNVLFVGAQIVCLDVCTKVGRGGEDPSEIVSLGAILFENDVRLAALVALHRRGSSKHFLCSCLFIVDSVSALFVTGKAPKFGVRKAADVLLCGYILFVGIVRN